MIDWYVRVLNTGHCELTPLMSLSIYVPVGLALLAISIWAGRWLGGTSIMGTSPWERNGKR